MADHVGVYEVSGALMPQPSTQNGSGVPTPAQFSLLRSGIAPIIEGSSSNDRFVSSSVIDEASSRAPTYAVEVKSLNAFFSGTEPIDPFAVRNIYYAKNPGADSNTSVPSTLRYNIYKHIPDISDVFRSPPQTAPSASSGSAPTRTGLSTKAIPYKAQFGTIASTTADKITINDLQSYITGTGATTASLTAALAANLIFFSGSTSGWVTASVSGVISLTPTTPGSWSLDITVHNCTVDDLTTAGITSNPVYISSWVPLINEVSGAFFNSTYYDPASVTLSATAAGKIRDIRAWVEFIHDRRTTAEQPTFEDFGLQGLQLAIRSPNTNFRAAHPLWNGVSTANFPLRDNDALTGTLNVLGDKYLQLPELLRNSYLLWDGHGADDGLRDSLSASAAGVSNFYHEFDHDVDMRTVFWDGSPVNNPKDVTYLFPSASETSPGTPRPYAVLETSSLGGYFYQSPTWKAALSPISGYVAGQVTGKSPLTCSVVPWMLDTRNNLGGLEAQRTNVVAANLSDNPPPGWNTGIGGMLQWQYASSALGTGTPPGQGGRVFVRPTTRAVHVLGGNDQDPGVGINPGTGSWYVHYTVNPAQGQFQLDTELTRSLTDLPFSPSKWESAVAYYTITTGPSTEERDRVILVGGDTGAGGYDKYIVGSWSLGNEAIQWSAPQTFPINITKAYMTVIGDKVYVGPGEKSVGVYFTGTMVATIDQTTGLPGAWAEHDFNAPTVLHSYLLEVGPLGVATSSDGGNSFLLSNTGTVPNLYASGVSYVDTPGHYMGVAGTKWFATNDTGTYIWSGSFGLLGGVDRFANGMSTASLAGNYYAVGNHIMHAPPQGAVNSTVTWTNDVNLIPNATNVDTYVDSLGDEIAFTTLAAETKTTRFFLIPDENSMVTFGWALTNNSFTGRNITYKVYERSNGGSPVVLKSGTLPVVGAHIFYDEEGVGHLSAGWANGSITFYSDIRPNQDFYIEVTTPAVVYAGVCTFTVGVVNERRPDTTLYGICSGAIGYMAVGKLTSTLGFWKSDINGTNWTHSAGGLPQFATQVTLYAVEYAPGTNGNRYIAAGGDNASNMLIYNSADGVTWSQRFVYYGTQFKSIAVSRGVTNRVVVVGSQWAAYSDNAGDSWTQVFLPYDNLPGTGFQIYDYTSVVWTGQQFVAVGTGAGGNPTDPTRGITIYSTDGATWSRGSQAVEAGVSQSFTVLAANSIIETVPFGVPRATFYASVKDLNDGVRDFGWTTFDDAGVFRTYRYELTGVGNWDIVKDGGVQELTGSDGGHYNPVVDSQNRVWLVGAGLGNISKYSRITWDVGHNRPHMSVPTQRGFLQVSGTFGPAISMSLAITDDVMATLNMGTTRPEVAATALVGQQPADGEFDTKGYQLGPTTIRPVYPLLDDVVVVKITDQPLGPDVDQSAFHLAEQHTEIIGSRPGLRNTELSGAWKLLLGGAASTFNPNTGYAPSSASAVWLRQVRLETISNVLQPAHEMITSKSRRFLKAFNVPAKDGRQRISILSGSAEWDIGVNYVSVEQAPDYGRSVGITDNTATIPDYAVLTFITGNLYTYLSESGVTNPSWFLAFTGTDISRPAHVPYIPDSLMSLGTGTAEQVDAAAAKQLYNSTIGLPLLIPNANDLAAYLSRNNYPQTMVDAAAAAQTSGTSSQYFPGLTGLPSP